MSSLEAYASSIFIILLGVALTIRGEKDKTEFTDRTGKILRIVNKHERYPNLDLAKYRYIYVSGCRRPLQVFIGRDPGDFTPVLERIDQLTVGDSVTVYADGLDDSKTSLLENMMQLVTGPDDDPVNRHLQFIDKGGEPYFIEGDYTTRWGIGFIASGIGLIAWIYWLKRSGKLA